jgi:hypothetical protein
MHPQLSPVAAQMRLDDLSGRRQRPSRVVPSARAPWRFGRRRTATRPPVPATLPVAPVVALPDCRACSDAVRSQYVA